MMDWLPPIEGFRSQFATAQAATSTRAKLEGLSALANTRLGYLETIQLDGALGKLEQATDTGFEAVRLAILAASTADHLLPAIRVAGLRRGLHIKAYASGYGQHRQELLNPGSALHAFKPDAIALSLVAREFFGATPASASEAEATRAITQAVDDIRSLWRAAKSAFGGLIIQQSFLDVEPPLFGGLDAIVPGAPARLVSGLNAALAVAAQADGVLWLDVARAAARDGLHVWFEPERWLQAKMEIAPGASALYGELVARLVAAARGRSRKCLVLDLDNTLWGGVIGDDGLEGIKLGQGSAVGEAHLALQRYARALRDRGIILAVCSKNEASIAEAVFRDHPEMLLKRSDIAAFVANWDDKATNLRAIARQLNIGLDSLVFVDDNPVERGHIRAELPMVAVPELPADPAFYVRRLSEAGYFEAIAFTREDQERSQQYAANAEREEMLNSAGGLDAYLQNLDMRVEYGPVTGVHIARATQLINKTNQFNNTTIRRTEQEIEAYAGDRRSIVLQFRLIDRFGDNGLVSVMLMTPADDAQATLDVASWVMSCRVFGRELEDEALNIAVEAARARGVTALRAAYVPTPKNGVIRDLFSKLGFHRIEGAEDEGPSLWLLDLADYRPRATRIARAESVHV